MSSTLVASMSSTTMYPLASVATPARSRSRSCVFGRRPTASSKCDPSITRGSCSQLTCTAPPLLDSEALRRGADCYAVVLEDRVHGVGYVLVLARDEARRHLYDHHLAAKAPV